MRLLGIILLVSSSYLLGGVIAAKEGERLKAISSLILMLQFLFRRMETESKPLYLLFSEYNDGYLEKCGFLPRLRNRGSELSAGWQEAAGLIPLEEPLINEVCRFGESLGRLGLEPQLKQITVLINLLEQEKEKLRLTLPKKQKSIKAVAFLLGALTAIILI